jgi:hypothetical protein
MLWRMLPVSPHVRRESTHSPRVQQISHRNLEENREVRDARATPWMRSGDDGRAPGERFPAECRA